MLCNAVVAHHLKTLVKRVIPKKYFKKKNFFTKLCRKVKFSFLYILILPLIYCLFILLRLAPPCHIFLKIGILPNLKLSHFFTHNKNMPKESQKFEFNY